MKKGFIAFFFTLLLIGVSCKKQQEIYYVTKTETAEALLNSDIDSSQVSGQRIYNIIPGTKTVFTYDYISENKNPAIADGYNRMTYAFAISLSPSQTSFSLIDDQIKQSPGFYAYYVFYGPSPSGLITKGKITGTKINSGTWNVMMHFEFANSSIDLIKNFLIK